MDLCRSRKRKKERLYIFHVIYWRSLMTNVSSRLMISTELYLAKNIHEVLLHFIFKKAIQRHNMNIRRWNWLKSYKEKMIRSRIFLLKNMFLSDLLNQTELRKKFALCLLSSYIKKAPKDVFCFDFFLKLFKHFLNFHLHY